jgi:hypothetical protein
MRPPVGKSGPGTSNSSSSSGISGFLMIAIVASMISFRLCGGIFVAMPTAIPPDPFTSSCGNFAGRTLGSSSESS